MNRTQIVRNIRQRHINRQPLNLSAVKRDDPRLVEAVYSVKPYWGWKAALAEAGIDYGEIRVEVRQFVECLICHKRFQALTSHLAKLHELTAEEYRDNFPEAELVSERMREQLTGNAHVPQHPDHLKHWEPIYTPEYVLDRLNEYAQQGFWMDSETINQIDCALIQAVRNYLEVDWDSALRQIGLEPVDYRGLVRDDDFTFEDFRKWLDDRERQGLECTQVALLGEFDQWRRHPRLYVWAMRRFSNWRAALQAANVDLSKPVYGNHRFLTRQQVREEINRMKNAEEELSHTAISLLPHGGQLIHAASREYGTWTAALDALRVPKRLRVRRASYDSPDDVLQAISHRIENQYALTPLELYYGTRSDIPLWKRAFECFGSWQKGVAKAGGNAGHKRQASDSLFPTKDKVLAELRRRHAAGQLLAKREIQFTENDKHLYVMAVGYFATWQTAVRAAGFDPKEYHQWNLQPIGKYANEEQIIAAIEKRSRLKQPLNARGLTHGEHQDVPLLYTARKLFGGWPEAIKAAGLEYGQVARKQQDYSQMKGRTYRSYPTRDDVIAEIQRRLKEGLKVTHRAISQGEHGLRDNALLIAGKKFFAGDWDKALRAAGVDLNELHPAWVRERKKRLKRKNQ